MNETMHYIMHSILEHLHSSHFWVGVGITMLFVALIAILVMVANSSSIDMPGSGIYPYGPYGY